MYRLCTFIYSCEGGVNDVGRLTTSAVTYPRSFKPGLMYLYVHVVRVKLLVLCSSVIYLLMHHQKVICIQKQLLKD